MRSQLTSRLTLAAALSACLATTPLAAAQDDGLNAIVVTGTRIDASEMQKTPNITLRVQADFVLFEVGFVNASLDQAERQRDLGRAYDALIKAAAAREDISLRVGDVEEAAPVETVTFKEARYDNGQRAGVNLVVKLYTKPEDAFEAVRARLDGFLKAIPEFGRTQYFVDDEQYLGITDISRHRPALIRAIGDEVTFLSDTFKASEVSVYGLEAQTVTQTVGPLELQIFIPYSIHLTSDKD